MTCLQELYSIYFLLTYTEYMIYFTLNVNFKLVLEEIMFALDQISVPL